MRYWLLLIFVLHTVVVFEVSAKEKVRRYRSRIEAVTVFSDAAEVHRSVELTVDPGISKVIFTGLSPKVKEQSLHATASNYLKVVSVSFDINYKAHEHEKQKIEYYRDSVKLMEDQLRKITNDKSVLEEVRKLLISSSANFGKSGENSDINKILAAADSFKARLEQINAQLYTLEKKQKSINNNLEIVNVQMDSLSAIINTPVFEVSVTLSAERSTITKVDLKYLVSGAGWEPKYLIRADVEEGPIELNYMGKVHNSTGVYWDKVHLKLSTGDPEGRMDYPELPQWSLNYDLAKNNSDTSKNDDSVLFIPGTGGNTKGSGKTPMQVASIGLLYEINVPYNIPSDGKPYMVDINELFIPASYHYFVVPKISQDCYLVARLQGCKRFKLMDGIVDIYYGGNYVGKSYIKTDQSTDTLDISLGIDKKVLLTREEIGEQKEETSGNRKKQTFSYRINIQNTNKHSVEVVVKDQIPVSKEDDIEIEVSEISGADYEPSSGLLQWKRTIKPGAGDKIDISYTVGHPKNKKINFKRKS